jgi:hypothetical protein
MYNGSNLSGRPQKSSSTSKALDSHTVLHTLWPGPATIAWLAKYLSSKLTRRKYLCWHNKTRKINKAFCEFTPRALAYGASETFSAKTEKLYANTEWILSHAQLLLLLALALARAPALLAPHRSHLKDVQSCLGLCLDVVVSGNTIGQKSLLVEPTQSLNNGLAVYSDGFLKTAVKLVIHPLYIFQEKQM